MSIWTCKVSPRRVKAAGALAAFLVLPGCLASVNGLTEGLALSEPDDLATFAESQASTRVLRRARLAGGDVTVLPPKGFCIDGDTLRDRGQSFALIAACSLLTGRVVAEDVAPALMTVTLHRGQEMPGAQAMAVSLKGAVLLQELELDGVRLLQVDGPVPEKLSGADSQHWRAMTTVNGHLVSMALYAEPGSTNAGSGGLEVLAELAQNIRVESPRTAALPTSTTEAGRERLDVTHPRARPGDQSAEQKVPTGISGLLARLTRKDRPAG